jgi:hypothetical protein
MMTIQKNWTVAWKPIDKATAEPKYSEVIFESFPEADSVARSMNRSDPEHHYFPTLCDDIVKPCGECGMLVKESELKNDPTSHWKICKVCYQGVIANEVKP